MKLPSFRSLKAKLTTSTDVATALTTNAAQLASMRGDLADMEAMRPGLLLDGDDSAVDAHEARLVEVRRTVARLEARSDALEAELATAGAREADAALTKRRADAKARAEAVERWLRDTYPDAARSIVEGLQELAAAEREVRKTNDALVAAGRDGEALPMIETRVHGQETPGSLTLNTSLMPVPELDVPGYGIVPLTYPWAFGTLGDVRP